MSEVLILGGARTPIATWRGGRRGDGRPGGALQGVDVFDLGATALRGAIEKTGIPSEAVDGAVFGFIYHTHPNCCYGARYIGLRAGLSERVPCLSVNMTCGTGLQAAVVGCGLLAAGDAALVAVGGCENTSQVGKDVLLASFKDLAADAPIGRIVEKTAAEAGVGRVEADAWALLSHERALAARRQGLFAEEIVPVDGVRQDDHVLEQPALDYFSKSAALYGEGGVVTRRNTHGLADGGAALILADARGARRFQAEPLGRIAAHAFVGVAPTQMAYASVLAIRSAAARAGWKLSEVDLFEINETFAAQILIALKTLDLPAERVNVNGGAVGLGHPFGATGARMLLTLLLELRRRRARKGIAAICIGAGQGVSVAVEAL